MALPPESRIEFDQFGTEPQAIKPFTRQVGANPTSIGQAQARLKLPEAAIGGECLFRGLRTGFLQRNNCGDRAIQHRLQCFPCDPVVALGGKFINRVCHHLRQHEAGGCRDLPFHTLLVEDLGTFAA